MAVRGYGKQAGVGQQDAGPQLDCLYIYRSYYAHAIGLPGPPYTFITHDILNAFQHSYLMAHGSRSG